MSDINIVYIEPEYRVCVTVLSLKCALNMQFNTYFYGTGYVNFDNGATMLKKKKKSFFEIGG